MMYLIAGVCLDIFNNEDKNLQIYLPRRNDNKIFDGIYVDQVRW